MLGSSAHPAHINPSRVGREAPRVFQHLTFVKHWSRDAPPSAEPGPHIALGILKHRLPGYAPVLAIFKCTVGVLAYENGSHTHNTHLIASIRAAVAASVAAVPCWQRCSHI